MGRRIYEVLTCDRKACGKEYETKGNTTIDHLAYMAQRNGGGSADSNMSKMLCPECTEEFLQFINGSPKR